MIGLPFSSVGKNGSRRRMNFLKKLRSDVKNDNGAALSSVGIVLPPFNLFYLTMAMILQFIMIVNK